LHAPEGRALAVHELPPGRPGPGGARGTQWVCARAFCHCRVLPAPPRAPLLPPQQLSSLPTLARCAEGRSPSARHVRCGAGPTGWEARERGQAGGGREGGAPRKVREHVQHAWAEPLACLRRGAMAHAEACAPTMAWAAVPPPHPVKVGREGGGRVPEARAARRTYSSSKQACRSRHPTRVGGPLHPAGPGSVIRIGRIRNTDPSQPDL